MKLRVAAGLALLAFAATTIGQTAGTSPVPVKMCDLYMSPEKYSGKLVQFRAIAMGRDLKHLWLDDFAPPQGCSAYMAVIAVLPNTVHPKPKVDLVEDETWGKFIAALPSMRVEATFAGVFEPYFVWREHKRIQVAGLVPRAYRKKSNYDARLILQNVSDVDARRVPHK